MRREGSARRAVVLVATGIGLGQLFLVVVSPVLTRLFTPAQFGLYTLYIAIFSFISTIVGLRLELAIPLARDDRSAAQLAILSLLSGVFISSGVLVFVLVQRKVLTPSHAFVSLYSHLWILPLSLFGFGLFQTASHWSLRMADFRDVAIGKSVQGIALGAGQVVFGSMSAPVGLALGDGFGRMIAGAALGARQARSFFPHLNGLTLSQLRSTASEFRRFPLISSPAGLLNSAALNLPAFVLGGMFGSQVTGWFGLAVRVIGLPSLILGGAIGQVYLNRFSEAIRTNAASAQAVFRRYITASFFLGIPIFLVGFTARWSFPVVFGAEWSGAARFAQLLSFAYWAQFTVVPISQTLNAINKQGIQFLWDASRLLIVSAALVFSTIVGLSPEKTLLTLSASLGLSYAGLALISWRTLRRWTWAFYGRR